MNKSQALVVLACSLTLTLPLWADVKKVYSISMVGSNAIATELPYAALQGKSFHASPSARFVKIHMFFDEPIPKDQLKSIKVASCVNPFTQGYEAFINFDEAVVDPDISTEVYMPEESDAKVMTADIKNFSGPVYSITLNFLNQRSICVQSIALLDEKKKTIPVQAPRVVEGSITASSTLSPTEAYSAENLFDSRFEYSWASNKEPSNVSLNLSFTEPQQVTKIKIWNGYQRSRIHCQKNSRVKSLQVTGDGGYSAVIPVKDDWGGQVLDLPKPFKGSHLTLKVLDSFRGSAYPEVVISELRLFDGRDWFLINPIQQIQRINRANGDQFAKAGLADILGGEIYSESWGSMRFRADGSLYLMGSWVTGGEQINYYALGGYEVLSAGPTGIKLRIFGLLHEHDSELGGDCNGCGFNCNSPNVGSQEMIFQGFLTLRADEKSGQVIVTDESKQRKMSFETLSFIRTSVP